MATFIRWGKADNNAIWSQVLPRNPMFSQFGLTSLEYGIFQEPFTDTNMFEFAYVYCLVRSGNLRTPRSDVDTGIIGELLAPNLPAAEILSKDDARKKVIEVAKRIPRVGLEDWQVIAGTPNDPMTEDQLNAADFPTAYKVIKKFAEIYGKADPNIMTRCVLGMFVGLVRRGEISDDYRTKLQDALRTEMSINISVDTEFVRKIYHVYGPFINSNVIKRSIARWLLFIPPPAIRLRTMAQQASWDGLTNFVQIREALIEYPDFYWLQLSLLTPYGGEFINYQRALTLIDGDEYYGYNPDLKDAVSTKYKALAWVCIQLHIKVGGKGSLRAYGGRATTAPHRETIMDMIERYKEKFEAPKIIRGQHLMELQTINDIMKKCRGLTADAADVYAPADTEYATGE